MWLLIRDASAARDLRALIPLAQEFGPHRIAFCTDDREPEHIAREGHVNSIVRDAVGLGCPPEDALVMASLNPATWHGLSHHGALGPGYQADLLLLPDLESFVPDLVLKRGRPIVDVPPLQVPEWMRRTVHLGPVAADDFQIPWTDGAARVIGLIPDQIVTASLVEEPTLDDGRAVADPERDLAKVAVLERHLETGRVGLGFVRGFGLQRGAFGTSLAHDAHNVLVVGVDDEAMARVAGRLHELGGGIVVADERGVRAELPLPVAGLLSDRPLADVLEASSELDTAVRALGVTIPAPFQLLSFLSLSVVPSLKITDRGLVDVERFRLVPLEVPERPDPSPPAVAAARVGGER